MALLEHFIERFGIHLFANRTELKVATSMEFEQMAAEFQAVREDEPYADEKSELSAQLQRPYQETRELATLACLWAATANASTPNGMEKFHKFLGMASTEFNYDEFYEKGDINGHMVDTANLLASLHDESNRNQIYEYMKEYSSVSRPDPLAEGNPYSGEVQNLLLAEALKIVTSSKHMRDTPIPVGEKQATIILKKSEVEKKGRKSESEAENAILWKRRKAANHQTIVAEATDLQKELDRYNPLDDTIIYDSKDGRITFAYGDVIVEFFDLLGVANRMMYEAKVWQAKKKETKIIHGMLDMAIDEASMPTHIGIHTREIRRQDAKYGFCPVAFDSDARSWSFEFPFKETPGVYRRNAIGWIVTK